MKTMLSKVRFLVAAVLAAGALALWAAGAHAATVTFDNSAGTQRWNTNDEDNWVGDGTLFQTGDSVVFQRPPYGARYPINHLPDEPDVHALGDVLIRNSAGTPTDVAPANVRFNSSGYWWVSGGGITSGSVNIGWDANPNFTGYTTDALTFNGGTTIESGWLTFSPAAAGTYHFGTGNIIASQRGDYVGFKFEPSVAGCTLANNFIVPAAGAGWYGTTNGGKILGTVRLDGNLTFKGGGTRMALDSAVTLTGDRRIFASNGSYITSPIASSGGPYTLTLEAAGNTPAWTDWRFYVQDDTSTPVWNIAGVTKTGTANVLFGNSFTGIGQYRDLGNNLNLRTGAIVVGGFAAATDILRDTASLNFQGGKLLLRRNGTGSETETVGSINLQYGHGELFLSANASQTRTLAVAAALTRTNYATALVSGNNLGGSGGAAGSTQVTLPSAPTLIGGGGGAGSHTISIVPFLVGGTSVTDTITGIITADHGSTFVTYDSGSLRALNTSTEFATSLTGAGSTTNVRRTSAETLAGNADINSLILDGSGGAFALDMAGNTLTLNSGALLARGNSGTTLTIGSAANDGFLDFANGEGIVTTVGANYVYGFNTVAGGLAINSVIQNGSLTKAGYGTLHLYGNNTFAGPLVVNSGGRDGNNDDALRIYGTQATTDIHLYGSKTFLQANDVLNPAASPMVDSAGQLNLNGYTQTFKNLQNGPNGGGTVTGGGASILTLNPDAGDATTFTGSFTGLARLVKEGPNVLAIGVTSGPAQIHLEDGILRQTASFSASQWHFRGGILEGPYSFRDRTYNTNVFFGPDGGGWSARGGNMTIWINSTTAQEWGVSPGFVLGGDPLMFNTIYSDAVVQYDSYINLGSSGTNDREFRVADNPGSTTDYARIYGVVSGPGAGNRLWKTGAGLLYLSGNNTYTGGTYLQEGSLRILTDLGLGAVPGAATTNLTVDTGTLQFAQTGTVLHANRTVQLNTAGTLTVDTQTYSDTVAGQITGDGALAKSGAGTLTLTGANDYTGGTTVNAGTLTAGNATALGNGGPLALAASGVTLNVNGNSLTVGALSGVAGSLITNAGTGTATATLTSDFDTTSSTYAGVIQNGATRLVALAKDGTGTLDLTGSNTYTGGTTVNGGTVLVGNANALGTTGAIQVNNDATLAVDSGVTLARHSAITFNAGSTLGGNGTYSTGGTSWTAPAGLTIAPGMSIGELTLDLGGSPNTFDLNGATLEIEVADDGTCDLLIVNGNLDLTATDNALILTGTVLKGYTYTIASTIGGGLVDGTFDLIDSTGLNGAPTIIYNADSIQFFVPEPATAAVLALAASAALLRRRRPARG